MRQILLRSARNAFAIGLPIMMLAACGDDSGTDPDPDPSGGDNEPPVAAAGSDETVAVGTTVQIDGSGSSDPDGDALSYTWAFDSRPSGSAATLSNASSATASFTADEEGTYRVELTVSDGDAEDSDIVAIEAATGSNAPTADIGIDEDLVRIGSGVAYGLDGSGSSDPDGDELSYTWTVLEAPEASTDATIDANTSEAPDFTPDAPGAYVVELSVSDGIETGTDTADFRTYDTELASISTDTTIYLLANAQYTMPSNVNLTAAVTIEPAVEVTVGQGRRLTVSSSGGTLTAVGTETDSIHFIGEQETAGYWDGIEVASTSPDNEFSYVEVAHAGDGSWSNIYVQSSGSASVTESRLHSGARHGLEVETDGELSTFSNNSFEGNGISAAYVPPDQIGSLDSGSNYAGGNADDVITVRNGTVSTAQNWPATDAPYYFSGNMSIQAATTIDPGVNIQVGQRARVTVSSAGGTLTAVGTETDSIRIVGEQETAGYWDGIEIASTSPDNEFSYVEIAHGGDNDWSNIYVQSTGSVSVTESRLHSSAYYGMYVESDGEITGFESNTLEDNSPTALRVPPDEITSLDGASTYVGGNTRDLITVGGGTGSTDGTWPATDAPYFFSGNVTVEAADTIEAGASFRMGSGIRLTVSASGGTLTAIGTSSDMIEVLGEQPSAGYWDGIVIDSNSPDNIFDYVDIGHGGDGNWANIYVESTGAASVTNSEIHDSAQCGLEVESGGVLDYDGSNGYSGNDTDVCEP